MMEKVIGFICCLLCSFPFFVFSRVQKGGNEPIVFWTRDTNLKEKVKDIKGYNTEIIKLYTYCALAFVLVGIIFFIHLTAAYICIGSICTLGVYIAWKKYKSILSKYS